MSNWTQPLCFNCWNRRNPNRSATAVNDAEEERCCDCNTPTRSGIYIRQNPQLTNYPRKDAPSD